MSKILKPKRLFQTFLFLLITGSILHLMSCNQGGGGREGGGAINVDTVRNHVITIGQADQMTASFRAALDSMKKVPFFRDSMDFGHAEAFPADVFRELLRQTDSSGPVYGIRIYYGRDPMERFARSSCPTTQMETILSGTMWTLTTNRSKAFMSKP